MTNLQKLKKKTIQEMNKNTSIGISLQQAKD